MDIFYSKIEMWIQTPDRGEFAAFTWWSSSFQNNLWRFKEFRDTLWTFCTRKHSKVNKLYRFDVRKGNQFFSTKKNGLHNLNDPWIFQLFLPIAKRHADLFTIPYQLIKSARGQNMLHNGNGCKLPECLQSSGERKRKNQKWQCISFHEWKFQKPFEQEYLEYTAGLPHFCEAMVIKELQPLKSVIRASRESRKSSWSLPFVPHTMRTTAQTRIRNSRSCIRNIIEEKILKIFGGTKSTIRRLSNHWLTTKT